jgi:hypothetical protein
VQIEVTTLLRKGRRDALKNGIDKHGDLRVSGQLTSERLMRFNGFR